MALPSSRRRLALERIIAEAVQKGTVPTTDEIMAAFAHENAKTPFDIIDRAVLKFRRGQVISSADINQMLDASEDGMKAAIDALSDGFMKLQMALDRSDALVTQRARADEVAGEARRMTGLDANAGAYAVSKAVSLADVEDFDLAASDDVFIDVDSHTMRLASTATAFKSFEATLDQVFQQSDAVRAGSIEICDPKVVTRPGNVARHIMQVNSTDENDDISLRYKINLAAESENWWENAVDVSAVTVETFGVNRLQVSVESTYDGLSWTSLGSAWGSDKIVIMGKARKAVQLRVTLRKTKADSIVNTNGTSLRYAYVFDTGSIEVGLMAFESHGVMVTDPIDLPGTGIASIRVDAEVVEPDNTTASIFVTSDVTSNIENAAWTKLEPGVAKDLITRNTAKEDIDGTDPIKYLEGSGSTNDLWIIGAAAKKIVSLSSGVNQARLFTSKAAEATVTLTRTLLEGSKPDTTTPILGIGEEIELTGNTVYRLEFSIWADADSSASLGFETSAPLSTKLYLNGSEKKFDTISNQVAVGLSQGRNNFVVLTVSAAPVSLKIIPPASFLCALERPVVKDFTQLADGGPSCATTDGKLIVNFDPTDMNHDALFIDEQGQRAPSKMRLKFVLDTPDHTVSPSISDIFVVAGV
jgi:hypothetical protein